MNWKKFRIALYALAALSGLISFSFMPENSLFSTSDNDPASLVFKIVAGVMMLIFTYPAILTVIGFQAKNPLSDTVWQTPDHTKNPFNFWQPLLVFHCAAFEGLFFAAGMVISAAWNGWAALFTGLFYALAFANVLVALKLCKRTCKAKFQHQIHPSHPARSHQSL